jgi:hypothetical protein
VAGGKWLGIGGKWLGIGGKWLGWRQVAWSQRILHVQSIDCQSNSQSNVISCPKQLPA